MKNGTPSSAEKEVVKLERKFWDEAANPAFVEEIFAEDGITIFDPARVIEKAEAVQRSAQSEPWAEVKLEDVTTRQLTPDCVVVAYQGTARKRGEKKGYRSSICSTYVRKGGRWQLGATIRQPLNDRPKTEETSSRSTPVKKKRGKSVDSESKAA